MTKRYRGKGSIFAGCKTPEQYAARWVEVNEDLLKQVERTCKRLGLEPPAFAPLPEDPALSYARRRIEEMSEDEAREMSWFTEDELIRYLRDEFYREPDEVVAQESAELEWNQMGRPKDQAH